MQFMFSILYSLPDLAYVVFIFVSIFTNILFSPAFSNYRTGSCWILLDQVRVPSTMILFPSSQDLYKFELIDGKLPSIHVSPWGNVVVVVVRGGGVLFNSEIMALLWNLLHHFSLDDHGGRKYTSKDICGNDTSFIHLKM